MMRAWQVNLCCVGLFMAGASWDAAIAREIRWLTYVASFGALACWWPIRTRATPHREGE